MSEYNIALTPWKSVRPSNKGGAGTIEKADTTQNIVWQTRSAPPTGYENALGDALEALFLKQIYDLPGIVTGLNEAGLHGPDGRYWTEASFQAEMKRLGG